MSSVIRSWWSAAKVKASDGEAGALFKTVQQALDLIRSDMDKAKTKSRLFSALQSARNDLFVLLQGDSTGDSSYEFFRVMAASIGALFPAYTVRYIPWVHASTSWGAVETIQTGTGARVITFYNGSQPGSTPSYWTGNRNTSAYDGRTFDLILTNYGLNVPDDWSSQAERLAEYLYTLRQQQPRAEIIVTVQPPDYNLLDRSANRADAQRWVCQQFGCRTIDAYSLFKSLVDADGGDTAQWYADGLHPSVAGGAQWAALALRVVSKDSVQHAALPVPAETMVPGGNFDAWPNGANAAPAWWETNSTCVQDTVFFETRGQAARCMGIGAATGVMKIKANELIQAFGRGQDIWIAAKLRSQGASNKPGALYLAHSASTAWTAKVSGRPEPSEAASGFRWVFLQVPASFYTGQTDFEIGVYSGEAGDMVTVDRMVIGNGPLLADSSGVCGWVYRFNANDSGTFTIPANGVQTRGFTSADVKAVRGGRVLVQCRTLPNNVQISARCIADGQIQVHVMNHLPAPVEITPQIYEFETGQ